MSPKRQNSFWTNLRYRIEFIFAVPALAIVRKIPVGAACRLAEAMGSVAFAILPRRRRLAIQNVLAAGITDSKKEAARIARASFKHLARVVAESFHASKITAETLEQHFEISAPQETWEILRDPKCGLIIYSGHIGNWEVTADAVSFLKPVTGIQRPMNNPYVQALLERTKMRGGFETIDKHDANPHQLVTVLRRGRALAILADQHATSGNIWIDFMGRPASTYVTPAVLHQLTHAPLVFCAGLNTDRPLHYKMIFSAPFVFERTKDRNADTEKITKALSDSLADLVRAYPEQYLWAHNRWRTRK